MYGFHHFTFTKDAFLDVTNMSDYRWIILYTEKDQTPDKLFRVNVRVQTKYLIANWMYC